MVSIFTFFSFNPAEASPSLWEIEFAKQLASVADQPFENGFEEMIQWTKEGKLWEFPVNNEAGERYVRSSEQSPQRLCGKVSRFTGEIGAYVDLRTP